MSEISANDIVIDDRFKNLLEEQTEKERTSLEELIKNEGCRDALVVWETEGKNILLDGHNRFAICQKLGIGFRTTVKSFDSFDDAADWVDRNQIARRNCTPEQYRIITGRIQNRRKRRNGERGPQKKLVQVEPAFDSTAKEVAAEFGISESTVKRNAVRAEVHDTLVEAGEKEAAKAIEHAPQTVVNKAAKAIKDESKPKRERVRSVVKITKEPKAKDKPPMTDSERAKHNKKVIVDHIGEAVRTLGDLNAVAPNLKLLNQIRPKIDEVDRLIKSWKV